MTENVTKVEGLAFTAKDEASATADKIGHSFERVHHAAEGARQKIGEFARNAATGALASVGLGFGLHSVFEKAEEANMEMARINKSVAGAQFALQGWRPGLSVVDKMTYSMKQSVEVGKELHEQALELREPIEQMGQVYNSVAAIGFGRLGMSQKQVLDLTEELAAASKVYGISAEEAVMTVNRALITGHIRAVGPFGIALRDALDFEHHKGGKHGGAKLTTEQMFARMEGALKSMVPAAKMMGKDMAGSMSEAKMLVDEMLRDLTGPMFKEQTKSLSEWVEKIRTVKDDGKSILSVYGEKIAGVFQELKGATAFIVDHWKSLLALYAASKFASFASGFAGKTGALNTAGIAGKVGDAVGIAMQPGLQSTMSKFASLAAKTGMVTEALGGLYLGLQQGAKWLDEWQTDHIQKQARFGADSALAGVQGKQAARHMESFRDLVEGGGFRTDWKDISSKAVEAMASYQAAYGSDIIKKTGEVDRSKLKEAWEQMTSDTRARQATGLGLASTATGEQFVEKLGELTKMLSGMLPGLPKESLSPNVPRAVPRGHGDINIQNLTITQDFKEADPDRVFHKVTNEISNLANTPGRGRLSTGMAGGL